MPAFQPEQAGQFSGHESCVNADVQIVPGHFAAKRPHQGTQEMRESRPPRFAKAHDSVISKHSTDPDQTLIGEMVQNQNAHECLPNTARKLVEQVALPPGNRFRQSARPRRKIQTGHQRLGKPTRNFPAQTPVSRADFNEAYPMPARCTRFLCVFLMARRNARLTQRILPIKALIASRSSRLRNAEGSSAGR